MDPLVVVKRSPEAVARHDKEAWLALFTDDATVQDPVGAAVYGRERLSRFWDVFITPHQIEFLPRRDFVQSDLVVRHVIISVTTSVSTEPLRVPAILEYRVQGDRIASLRAFWETKVSVRFYLSHALGGVGALLRHGGRMTRRLGLGASLAFGRALSPAIPRDTARALIEDLAGQIRDDLLPGLPRDGRRLGLHPEETLVAGDHVASVLSSGDGGLAAAVIARVRGERLSDLALIWS